jgi:dTDP-D-glucose 4,6-dehydratase
LLFVKDLSEICYLITQKSNNSSIYFLSEKKSYKWEEVANILSRVIDKKIKILKIPQAAISIYVFISENFMKYFKNKPVKLNRDKLKELSQKYWIADSSSAEQDFNFEFTPFETGAKITYNWYKENKWL